MTKYRIREIVKKNGVGEYKSEFYAEYSELNNKWQSCSYHKNGIPETLDTYKQAEIRIKEHKEKDWVFIDEIITEC